MISMTEGQPIPGFSDAVREAFSRKGLLAKSRDFEYRPQQQELAFLKLLVLVLEQLLLQEQPQQPQERVQRQMHLHQFRFLQSKYQPIQLFLQEHEFF